MNLEHVSAELRPRVNWAAADLGARLVQRDAGIIYRVWLTLALGLFLLVTLISHALGLGWLGSILYWWFEPVLDGPVLHLISQRLFGAKISAREALRQAPRLAWRNRLFWLTPYRLHPARSIAMPVTQLEGLTGRKRRERARVINRQILNHGIGLTVVFQNVTLALSAGLIALCYVMIPQNYQDSLGQGLILVFVETATPLAQTVTLALYVITQAILQPWFIGCGFGLYVNRRTALEAWDIEIEFRRMVSRRKTKVVAPVLLLLIACSSMLTLSDTARAEEPAESHEAAPILGYWDKKEVALRMETVESDESLRLFKDVERWRYRNASEPQEVQEQRSGNSSLSLLFALLAESGLWIVAALLLLLVGLNIKRLFKALPKRRESAPKSVRLKIDGLDEPLDRLPDNLIEEANHAWRQGDQRLALSLLYRGSLYRSVVNLGVKLPASATEADIVRAGKAQLDQRISDYLARLINAWQRVAWGHSKVAEDEYAILRDDWSVHFEAGT